MMCICLFHDIRTKSAKNRLIFEDFGAVRAQYDTKWKD